MQALLLQSLQCRCPVVTLLKQSFMSRRTCYVGVHICGKNEWRQRWLHQRATYRWSQAHGPHTGNWNSKWMAQHVTCHSLACWGYSWSLWIHNVKRSFTLKWKCGAFTIGDDSGTIMSADLQSSIITQQTIFNWLVTLCPDLYRTCYANVQCVKVTRIYWIVLSWSPWLRIRKANYI